MAKPSKPQERVATPLNEFRVGRCFTVKQFGDPRLLNVLEKTFKKESSNNNVQNNLVKRQ